MHPSANSFSDERSPSGRVRVEHPLHGHGVVESWRRGGRIAVVAFDNQPLPMEIPSRELGLSVTDVRTVAEDRTAAQALPEDLGEAFGGSFERGQAMMTLEAMRLGVVPSASLEAYTVGRDFEMSLVDGDLDAAASNGGAVRAFLGDYGVGKTHLLELILHRALEKNFLTARVVLDPEETAPSHPRRVYRAAIRTLRYPDRAFEEGRGLEPLLRQAAASPDVFERFDLDPARAIVDEKNADRERKKKRRKRPPRAERLERGLHLYLSSAMAYMASLARAESKPPRGIDPDELDTWVERSRDLLIDWIEGHPTISNQVIDQELSRLEGHHPRVYSLLDYRPWSRIYGYLLSGISTLAREVGYSGLVLLIDEAEFYGLLSPTNRAFARDLFKAWAWAALGPPTDDPEAGPQLPFGEDELGVGGYGIQRTLPGQYGDSPGLYVVFAMTPHGDGVEALRGAIPEACISQLGPLAALDYTELARRVCDFYASARPDWSLPNKLVEPLAKVLRGLIQSGYVQNPRHAMKFIIEFLDVVRFHPDKVGSVVRNLQSSLMF